MPTGSSPPPSFEDVPLTRSEYITTMVHFYRGEMARANIWRTRLDTTTNWAVVTTGGMLSFAFSQPGHSHVTLLLAGALVAVFLGFEARRFRYFDVWRSRIRMIEENFLIPILRRNLISPRSQWRDLVAEDLDAPTFKITYLQAVAMRLRRNYIWLYLVILTAWTGKLHLHPAPAASLGEVLGRMAIGPVPGGAVLAVVATGSIFLAWMAVQMGRQHGGSDEVHGVERSVDRWKA